MPSKQYENGRLPILGVITGLPRPYHNVGLLGGCLLQTLLETSNVSNQNVSKSWILSYGIPKLPDYSYSSPQIIYGYIYQTWYKYIISPLLYQAHIINIYIIHCNHMIPLLLRLVCLFHIQNYVPMWSTMQDWILEYSRKKYRIPTDHPAPMARREDTLSFVMLNWRSLGRVSI